MKRSALLATCRGMPGVTEDIKWGNDLVFSVGGKMFACLDAKGGNRISFKTTPGGFALLTKSPGVVPAPYAARFHWVLVEDEDALPDEVLRELIRESYALVVEKLPARARLGLAAGKPKERSGARKAARKRKKTKADKA